MEDESGTGFAEDTSAVDTAGTDVTTNDTAANDQTEAQTDQSTDVEVTTDNDDDVSWATKKGVNLEDKAKVAAMLRNADRRVSEAGISKNNLRDSVGELNKPTEMDDDVTVLRKEVHTLRSQVTAAQYYINHPEHAALDSIASSIIEENKVKNPALAHGLAQDLPELFRLAKLRQSEGSDEVAKAKDEGRKEERRALAGKQRASATSQAATSSTPTEDDAFLKGFMST